MSGRAHQGNGVSVPRFLVDAMLGHVARELRLLGYDAEYDSEAEDSALLRRAQAEGRILITRDGGLWRRARGVRCILVHDEARGSQTREILSTLGGGDPPAVLSRCTECNGRLEPLTVEEARQRVPDHIANSNAEFFCCPGCGRVYWRGSHAARLEEKVRSLLRG